MPLIKSGNGLRHSTVEQSGQQLMENDPRKFGACWKCKGTGLKPKKGNGCEVGPDDIDANVNDADVEPHCTVCAGKGQVPIKRKKNKSTEDPTESKTSTATGSSQSASANVSLQEPGRINPSNGSRDSLTESEPREGDKVYIVGHGPALLAEVAPAKRRGRMKYKVVYPDGTEYHVGREQILAHETPRKQNSPKDGIMAAIQRASPRLGGAPRTEVLGGGPRSPPPPVASGPRRLEYLGRAFSDSSRSMRTPSAIFSLVATMVGGGVLSLPYAMSQCGLILGTIALLLSAAASTWTLDMLVDCARSTGLDTFELVGHAAYGETSRKLTICLVYLICQLALVGYYVLLGDLLVPLVEIVYKPVAAENPETIRRLCICGATVLLSPMCFKGSLSALRFMCFASVGSVLVVTSVIGYRAIGHIGVEHQVQTKLPSGHSAVVTVGQHGLNLFPSDYFQALYVFPMFGVSFLCHFNALPTHAELSRPTRDRIRRVLCLTMFFTTLLYEFIGAFGYVFSCSATCGNILLNFPKTDPLVIVSRAAFATVLMLNFPLLCQPARNALYRLIVGTRCFSGEGEESPVESIPRSFSPAELPSEEGRTSPTQTGSPQLGNRQERPRASVHVYLPESTRRIARGATLEAFDTFHPKDQTVQAGAVEPTRCQRYLLTAGILGLALLVACEMKSVLVVWSILGSTVAFVVAFILPAAFWHKIVGGSSRKALRRGAAFVGIFFSMLALVCTIQTLLSLDMPACPHEHLTNPQREEF